jgi:hypothetical protein
LETEKDFANDDEDVFMKHKKYLDITSEVMKRADTEDKQRQRERLREKKQLRKRKQRSNNGEEVSSAKILRSRITKKFSAKKQLLFWVAMRKTKDTVKMMGRRVVMMMNSSQLQSDSTCRETTRTMLHLSLTTLNRPRFRQLTKKILHSVCFKDKQQYKNL